jgi:hypothetical protein
MTACRPVENKEANVYLPPQKRSTRLTDGHGKRVALVRSSKGMMRSASSTATNEPVAP